MEGTFKLKDPDKMEATLTMTMTIERWKRLREQLESSYPSSDLSWLITMLVTKAQKEFAEETKTS